MNKLVFIFLLVMLLPGIVQAVEYDLNNYELPDYIDYDLNMALDLNGNAIDTEYAIERDQEELSSKIIINYNMKKFSRKYLLSITGKVFLENSSKSITYQDSVDIDLNYDLFRQRGDINFLLRRYLMNKWYGQTNLDFSYHHSLNESDNQDSYHKRNSVFDANEFTTDVKAGIGYGRMEDASSACTARQILQELEAADLLVRECRAEDVKILADELLRLETLNVFDSRELRKQRYRQLWQKLTEMNLVINADIESFVIIQDLYELTGVFERETGWELTQEIYFNNQYEIDDNDIENVNYDNEPSRTDIKEYQDYEDNSNEYGIGMSGSYARILAMNWQFKLKGNFYYYNLDSEMDHDKRFVSSTSVDIYDDLSKRDYEGYKYCLDAGLNWYPDTRTEFWTLARVQYDHYQGDSSIEETDEEIVEFWTDIGEEYYHFAAGINYYFTPKLSTSIGIGYTIREYTGKYKYYIVPLGVDGRSLLYGINVMYYLF